MRGLDVEPVGIPESAGELLEAGRAIGIDRLCARPIAQAIVEKQPELGGCDRSGGG